MKHAMIFAYKTVGEASKKGHVLQNQGFTVVTSGPLDQIAAATPSGSLWPNEDGDWFMVVATQQPLIELPKSG